MNTPDFSEQTPETPSTTERKSPSNNDDKSTVTISRTHYLLIWLLCIAFAAGMVISTYRYYQVHKNYGSFITIADEVNADFYTDVDTDATLTAAKEGYVAGLNDPYSQYLTPDEYDDYNQTESGQIIGIGVTVSYTDNGYLYIKSVTEDSPAQDANIETGDYIIAVDDVDITTLSYDEAVDLVRGEEGTSVTLTLTHEDSEYTVDIIRETIDEITAYGVMIADNIAYIRISAFRENTPEQFKNAYSDLIDEGAQSIIFDVRNNGGGLVTSLEAILDPLLPEGEIAVATYRDGTTTTLVTSDAIECDLPIVVLVNGNTASAAELFSASISDFEKGILIGETTFGKGIMQSTRSEPDGGALTLTVATYQTTRGECYHGIGITPDIVIEPNEDDIIDYTSPNPETDSQLARAIEELS